MEVFRGILCNQCSELIDFNSINKPLISTSHVGCNRNGTWVSIGLRDHLSNAHLYIAAPVSSAQLPVTDVTRQTLSNAGDDTAGEAQKKRGQGRDGSNRSGPRQSLDDRVSQPTNRDRSKSPKSELVSYRTRGNDQGPPLGGKPDPRHQGWTLDGKKYIYNGQSYWPTSWHYMKYTKPRFSVTERYFDPWLSYRRRNHAHRIPRALELPHILEPHPIYGPLWEAQQAQMATATNAPGLAIEQKPESQKPKGQKGRSKKSNSQKPTGNTSKEETSKDDTYCLKCQNHKHIHQSCDQQTIKPFFNISFPDNLKVDMVKFQAEFANLVPANMSSLIEHMFAVRLKLEKAFEWIAHRNRIQLAIHEHFSGQVAIHLEWGNPKADEMLQRIIHGNLIVDDFLFKLRKGIKEFTAYWTERVRDDDKGSKILSATPGYNESTPAMILRLYTTVQPDIWPIRGFEERMTAFHDSICCLLQDYADEISELNMEVLDYTDEISSGKDFTSYIGVTEAQCYRTLIDGLLRLEFDPASWLDFIIVPALTSYSENDLFFGPMFDVLQRAGLADVEDAGVDEMETEDGGVALPISGEGSMAD